jgi:hypothetical protein
MGGGFGWDSARRRGVLGSDGTGGGGRRRHRRRRRLLPSAPFLLPGDSWSGEGGMDVVVRNSRAPPHLPLRCPPHHSLSLFLFPSRELTGEREDSEGMGWEMTCPLSLTSGPTCGGTTLVTLVHVT